MAKAAAKSVEAKNAAANVLVGNRELIMLVDVLAREKNVPRDIVFGALEMALASHPHVDDPDPGTSAFHRGKLQTCRYVFFHRLVETEKLIDIIVRPDASVLDMQDAWFD